MTAAGPPAFGVLDGDDTALARALHAGGVPLGALQRALAEARAARAGPGDAVSLAAALLTSGVVTPAQLEAARSHLAKTAVAASPAAPPALPATFGPYRVVRELGRGGMGVVLEVEDAAGRRGALKTLVAGADPALLARFRREATLQARLDHPHVAPIHAAGLEASPVYLVQAFLTGGTLAERLLARGPLPPAEVAALGRKLAAGLQHAHERGVLHRDLKPQNILFDERGEPRIIDFGLARALDGASMRLTATGEVLGTPAFIAPEVLTGAPVDVRTDVHGLAGLLYAALTGRPPHDGDGLFGTLNAALLHEPPRASTLRPDVPAWLDQALARGLAREPAERPPTGAALGALLAGEEAATPPSRRRRLRLASGLTCALVLAGVGLVLRRDPSEGPRPEAVQVAPEPAGSRPEARLVADVVEGRRGLPADPAGLAALALELRDSGVADLGTASATLVDLVGATTRDALARDRSAQLADAGPRPAADEVLRAVRRLAPDRPCGLTRAAAAALWSGVLAARAESDGGAERALVAAAALSGPDAEVGGQVAAFWRRHLEASLPSDYDAASDLVRHALDPERPERARLVGVAEAIELAWRARPDAAPFVEPRLRLLYERVTQTLVRHVHAHRRGAWPLDLGELGAALHEAAPTDPLFEGMATILDPPPVAARRAVDAMRRLERLAPGGEDVEITRSFVHNVLVTLLVDRCEAAKLGDELEGWLRTSLVDWPCGTAVAEAFARTLVASCKDDPGRVPEVRKEITELRDRSHGETASNLSRMLAELPPP